MYENLLDIIETHDKSFKGVVDFATKKQVIFYNFDSNENSTTLLILAILWKVEAPHMRFSVYRAKFYPHVSLKPAMVISRKAITNEYKNVSETHVEKITKRFTAR